MVDNLNLDLVRVLQDDDTQRLLVLLQRFNPFDVLRIGHYELRHTNTLSWLLDPSGNHGLEDAFLRTFIGNLQVSSDGIVLAERFETAADRSVTVRREVSLHGLRKAATKAERLGLEDDAHVSPVTREAASESGGGRGGEPNVDSGAMDVVLEGDGWLLAIEAKVRGVEGDKQLSKYRTALNAYGNVGSKRACHLVYLTVDGDPPTDPQWVGVSWQLSVIEPLRRTLEIQQGLNPEVRLFLRSYLDTLERYAGDGGEAERLAAEIAERHKDGLGRIAAALKAKTLESGTERIVKRHNVLIKLLSDQLGSPQAARAKHIGELLKKAGFERLGKQASYMPFAPMDWATRFKAMSGSVQGRVRFEVVNRWPTIIVKLLVPALGEEADDALADARRRLVHEIQASVNVKAFPGAFYRPKAKSRLLPRPMTPNAFSVFTTSSNLASSEAAGAADNFVQKTLEHIVTVVLPALEPLMTEAGIC